MTTAEATQFLDFDVPEELVEASSSFVGRVHIMGAQHPPNRLAQKSGNTYPHMHVVIEPLSIKYDSDLTLFEDNYEHVWAPMYTQANKMQGPNSNFGELSAAFRKLGFPVTNPASIQAITGKVFTFINKKTTRDFGKLNPQTGVKDTDVRDTWLIIPETLENDDWTPSNPVPTFSRPRNKAGVPSAATVATNEGEILPQLRDILRGKGESDYFQAVLVSGNKSVATQPYLNELSNNPSAITGRLSQYGMRLINGVLTD